MTEPGKAHFVSEILAATSNSDKIRELRTIAQEFSISLLSPDDLVRMHSLPPPPDVEEYHETYFGNAGLKAEAYAAWSGMPSLADDSGLEVAALGGEPGVRSARYAGEGASAEARWRKVLSELELMSQSNSDIDRSACFHCSLVMAYPDGASLSSSGTLPGEILKEPSGTGGFGYDPIVYIPELGKTLAEIPFSETCRIGFRAQAARDLFGQLLELRP